MTTEAFKRNFHGRDLPRELIWLYAFQQKMPDFAQGFALIEFDGSGLEAWSAQADFPKRLMPFARANRGDALHALWDQGLGKGLDEMPVVTFSQEAGMHVIAENLLGLMRVLTYDIDLIVEFESLGFYNDQEGYETSEYSEAYAEWLKEHFDVDPVDNPWDDVVDAAQEAYAEALEEWLERQAKH